MNHLYIAEDTTNHIKYQDECLHEITKQVRKRIKLCHGNLIRTALIEEGIYHAFGNGRKSYDKEILYHFEFTVVRF